MPLAVSTAARAVSGICALLGLLALSGCEGTFGTSPPHAAPARPSAEASDGSVELQWMAVTDATSYVIQWSNSPNASDPLSNVINDLTGTSYVHTGLTNLTTYRYKIVAETSGGRGPASLLVSGTPGPLPDPVEWAVVTNDNPGHTVYFATANQATGYRIFIAAGESALEGRRPLTPFADSTVAPWVRAGVAVGVPSYYRVIAMNDTRVGFGGPIIVSPTHQVATLDLARLGAAIGDPNADGCPDLVSASASRVDNVCTGTLTARNLTDAGLANLIATDRVNGDSRFADFTGDRRDDLFSSTSSLASATASIALFHVNQGTGIFQTNAAVSALAIGGFGGTLLAADFDNDGDLDLFAPYDHTRGDGARNWLLRNDGGGTFTDIAAAAGVDANPAGAEYVPRGGQAVDFNEDGFVDLLFGSRLLINDGDGTFSDDSVAAGIPVRADQGLKLFDVDLDGDLDLAHHDGVATRLHRNAGGMFDGGTIVSEDTTQATFGNGLNVCDVTSDGFEDVLFARNVTATGLGVPKLLVNVNGTLMPSAIPNELTPGTNSLVALNDLIACGDLDGNRVTDIVARWGQTYRTLRAAYPLSAPIRIRVLGSGGERNQQGRIVRIVPRGAPNRIMTRVIESGSGLRAQNQYDLLVGGQWPGEYDISVRFASGIVTATADPGEDLTIYADGRVVTGLN